MYIYHVRTHTHIHVYTHTHTKCTYERTQSTSETTALQRLRGQPNLTPRSSALLPVRITTARRPDHIRLSALVQGRSTQFIVHASSQLCHGPPKRGHSSAILAGFFKKESPSVPSAASYRVSISSSHVLRTSRNGDGKNPKSAGYVRPSIQTSLHSLNASGVCKATAKPCRNQG